MNKALDKEGDARVKANVITSINLLQIHRGDVKVPKLRLFPEITEEKMVYKDRHHGVIFIDAIEAAVPSGEGDSDVEGSMLTVSLSKQSEFRFSDAPLSLTEGGEGSHSLDDSIYCTDMSEDKKTIELFFKFPTPANNEFGSCTFPEIYFITERSGSGGKHSFPVDPTVIIIRG
ncbi:MAG: hypothetical protein AAF431_12780 [Pseudomonadota bacterium]